MSRVTTSTRRSGHRRRACRAIRAGALLCCLLAIASASGATGRDVPVSAVAPAIDCGPGDTKYLAGASEEVGAGPRTGSSGRPASAKRPSAMASPSVGPTARSCPTDLPPPRSRPGAGAERCSWVSERNSLPHLGHCSWLAGRAAWLSQWMRVWLRCGSRRMPANSASVRRASSACASSGATCRSHGTARMWLFGWGRQGGSKHPGHASPGVAASRCNAQSRGDE